MLVLNLQTLREGTKYASYRITLPKNIMEAKGWEKSRFEIKLGENMIILKPIRTI